MIGAYSLHSRSLILAIIAMAIAGSVQARNASFVEPGSGASKVTGSEILTADPKQYDAGESVVGVARRVTLFFANTGGPPVVISEVNAVGDGNVVVQLDGEDCKKNGKLASAGRCSVTLAVTPTSAGPWSAEILAIHDGPGRIARAMVSGKAVNDAKTAARGDGLNINNKESRPVDFGDVDVTTDIAVRTALMINDSPNDIKLLSIDLVVEDKGLEKLKDGCEIDQVLKPGESCPITLRWQPPGKGSIATDLIVRHTGKIGFTVIPIRGHAVGRAAESETAETGAQPDMGRLAKLPVAGAALPSAEEIEAVATKLPPVTPLKQESQPKEEPRAETGDSSVYFIGQVGNRAILQRRGLTKVVALEGEAEFDGTVVHLVSVNGRNAKIRVNGALKEIQLQSSGYRPLPSVKQEQKPPQNIAATSSNSQSSSGKQGVDVNGTPGQPATIISGP